MKVYGRWKVTIPGEEYIFDPDYWMGSVWSMLETDLDMTMKEFVIGLDPSTRRFRPCQWLIWYLRRLDGKETDLLSVDFPLLQFRIEEIPDPEAVAATGNTGAATSSDSSSDTESDQATGTT